MGGFEAVYEKIKAYSEMTKSECAFIYDLCQERKPKKIVESMFCRKRDFAAL